MASETAAIKQYINKLPEELSSRYGTAPYTQGQVDRTVNDLRLSDKFIRYAYLIYCEQKVLQDQHVTPAEIQKMQELLAVTAAGGIVAIPVEGLFNLDGDGAGGLGDIGGGAGE